MDVINIQSVSTKVAIGNGAGNTGQGSNSVAIGTYAGQTGQAGNTIILNASGVALNGVAAQVNSFYVKPIRTDVTQLTPLCYNSTSGEIVQGPTGTWIGTDPTVTVNYFPTGGVTIYSYNMNVVPFVGGKRYLVTVAPINDPPYVTSRDKTLTTIIEYNTKTIGPTGGVIYGGSTTFLDINNYITVSADPYPNFSNYIQIIFASNSVGPEFFQVIFRNIN